MRYSVLVVALVLMATSVFAQRATFKMAAPDYRDRPVRILEVVNFISGETRLIQEGQVDMKGYFNGELAVSKSTPFILSIDGVSANLIVQNGAHYSFTFPKVDVSKGRKLTDNQVTLIFEKGTETRNINAVLGGFDKRVEEFSLQQAIDVSYRDAGSGIGYRRARMDIEENVGDTIAPVTRDMLAELNLFENKVMAIYADYMSDPFIENYIRYSVAGLELQAGKKRWEIYYEYLHESDLLRDNPEYARFLGQFYGGLFVNSAASGDYRYMKAVNSLKDADEVLVQLSTDLYMDDPNMAMAAMLINLQEVYPKKGWNRSAIDLILNTGAKSERFKAFNQDFAYTAGKIGGGMKGYQLPNFKMLDPNQEIVHKGDFGGKYLYIGFFTSWSSDCYREMQLLKKMNVKYGREIEFISVSLDDNYEAFTDFVVANPGFDWQYLYGPSYNDVYDIFQIYSVPTFVLVAPDGRIMYDFTRSPSEGINLEFEKIMKRSKTTNKVKVWDD